MRLMNTFWLFFYGRFLTILLNTLRTEVNLSSLWSLSNFLINSTKFAQSFYPSATSPVLQGPQGNPWQFHRLIQFTEQPEVNSIKLDCFLNFYSNLRFIFTYWWIYCLVFQHWVTQKILQMLALSLSVFCPWQEVRGLSFSCFLF